MKDIFHENYQKIREQYGRIIHSLQIVSRELNVKFFLIGAQSRNVWSSHLKLNKRETRDIDYSVQLRDFSQWHKIVHKLTTKFGVIPDKDKPYRFKLDDQEFDLLPFGNFAENDEVILGDNSIVFSVLGFQDIANNGAVEFGNEWIVSLPGLCVLKLISYSEKSYQRIRDFEDFLFLLFNLTDIYGDSIYDDENFLNQLGNNIDIEIISANKLGCEMNSVIRENKTIRTTILKTLNKELGGLTIEEIIKEYKNGKYNSPEITKFRLIAELIRTIDISA